MDINYQTRNLQKIESLVGEVWILQGSKRENHFK